MAGKKLVSKNQLPWQELDEEWVKNWKFRLTPAARSRVLLGKGVESDKEYTERRKRETTKRTWRSDAADIAHGIGEGVLALHPYTAIPYFGAKVGQDVLDGNVNWQTALNASVPLFHLSPQAVGLKEATNVALEDAANAGSKTARNWRVAREIKQATKSTKLDNNSTVIPHEDLFDFWHGGLESDFDFKNLDLTPKIGLIRGISGVQLNITPTQWTAAQDAAIARGDISEAQRLRDLHFEVSAPNTQIKDIQYHGAKGNAIFNVFDPKLIGQTDQGWAGRGYYFTPSKDYAKMYGSEPRAFYINAQKVHDGTASTYFGREDGPAAQAFKIIRKKHGNDGQQILDDLASSDAIRTSFSQTRPYNGIFEEVVTRNNNQMKLADAVTYDNNGIRIPLGERDNFNISDIRYFSQQPIVRTVPEHTAVGNPLQARLTRLLDHVNYGTDVADQAILVKPVIRGNEIRNVAKQLEPNLTDSDLDLISQIVYANRKGAHIPIENGSKVSGISVVDILEAINYLKESGVKNPNVYDVGIIAGHEAGHGVQVSPKAKQLVLDFVEPEEFYTRAGQILDDAGVFETSQNPVSFGKFMQFIDNYLKRGNLDNGISALKLYMLNISSPIKRLLVMGAINRFSVGTGSAYLLNNGLNE